MTTQISLPDNSRQNVSLSPDLHVRDGGFSLIEVLIALAILALAISVALPGLNSGLAAASRQAILTDVSRQVLEYRIAAFDSAAPSALMPAEQLATRRQPGSATPVVLKLPSRWGYRVAKPIVFSADGYCSGGQIALELDGRQQMVLNLSPNRCVAQAG